MVISAISLSRSGLKAGHVYRRFILPSGMKVTLRVLRWEDLDNLLSFINSLVKEKQRDARSHLYTGFDKKVSREEEAEWLGADPSANRNGRGDQRHR